MVSVQLRNAGQGLWTALTLPSSVQVAQTLATAERTLDLADEIRIQPSAEASPPASAFDIKV